VDSQRSSGLKPSTENYTEAEQTHVQTNSISEFQLQQARELHHQSNRREWQRIRKALNGKKTILARYGKVPVSAEHSLSMSLPLRYRA
jgi:hypothetical protein